MIPDAEIISLLCTILGKLDVGEFTVKVSITIGTSWTTQFSTCRPSSITAKSWMASLKSVAFPQTKYARFPRQ
jgi:hypothetical protein